MLELLCYLKLVRLGQELQLNHHDIARLLIESVNPVWQFGL